MHVPSNSPLASSLSDKVDSGIGNKIKMYSRLFELQMINMHGDIAYGENCIVIVGCRG